MFRIPGIRSLSNGYTDDEEIHRKVLDSILSGLERYKDYDGVDFERNGKFGRLTWWGFGDGK